MAINLVNDNISAIEIKGKKYNIKAIPFHGTAAEWENNDYVPKDGEIIIYDIDENYNYTRVKVGDGNNTAINLSFLANLWNLSCLFVLPNKTFREIFM